MVAILQTVPFVPSCVLRKQAVADVYGEKRRGYSSRKETMRKLSKVAAGIIVSAFALFLVWTPTGVDAQSPPATGEVSTDHDYIGVTACARRCHARDRVGGQLGLWEDSAHANAYSTLGTPQAAEVGAAAGIEGNPQEAAECLRCHTTAWGVADSHLGDRFDRTQGVQCESCHGPGADFKSRDVHAESQEAGIAAGLVIPTEEVCVTCHNSDSPTFEAFNYDERAAEIAHPVPEEEAE